MSPAYRRGIREHLPDAHVTFDRFHVVQLLNDAVYKVRRAERREAPELKRTRYLWLKNEHSLSGSWGRLRTQLLYSRRHLKTVSAYQLKLSFRDFWGLPPGQAPCFSGPGAAGSRNAESSPWRASLELLRPALADIAPPETSSP